MNYDDRICLDQLKIEHDTRLEKTREQLEKATCSTDLGMWLIYFGAFVFLGWLFSFVHGLVKDRSIAWVAGLTYGISCLQTGCILWVVFKEGFQTIRRIRYNGKVRKLKRKFLSGKTAGITSANAFHSAKHKGWDLPLTSRDNYIKQIAKLQRKCPSEFEESEWTYSLFSFLCYPLSIGWTITGSLALGNVFSVREHFANWVIILGLFIACAAAVYFVHWMREDYEELYAVFAYLIGPLAFIIYMLIATVILLISMLVGWFLSALPVILVIGAVILWIKNS